MALCARLVTGCWLATASGLAGGLLGTVGGGLAAGEGGLFMGLGGVRGGVDTATASGLTVTGDVLGLGVV